MKSITITVDPDGKTNLEGGGFKGKECDKVMGEFEKQLGSVSKRTNKPEYHQQPVSNQQKVGGG